MTSIYHKSVLLNECLEGLLIRPSGIYVDVTFGGGGHTRAILDRLNENGRVIAFDQDEDALQNVPDDKRFTLVGQNFRFLKNFLRLHGAIPVHGILADLGISSHQIDRPDRGFSTRFDGPLDMRMNRNATTTAADVLNTYQPILTIAELKEAIAGCLPRGKEFRYLAQVFQALRIEINAEMKALEELLKQSVEVLAPGGRLVVISYHSLEDRMVKNFMRSGNIEGKEEKDFYGNLIRPLEPVNRKAIVPTDEEIELNSRARSAKLRIAEKSRIAE